MVTLGLYYPIWFLRRRRGLNEMKTSRRLNSWPFVTAVVFALVRLFLSGATFGLSRVEFTSHSFVGPLVTWGALAVTILMVFQCFLVKHMIEDHIMGDTDSILRRLAESVRLSRVLTLFLGIFYLQYVINQRVVGAEVHSD